MRRLNSYYYFVVYLSMILSTYLYSEATSFEHSPKETSLTNHYLTGQLANGLTYTLIPSSNNSKGGSWIKWSCAIPQDKDLTMVSELAQHALFYGNKQKTREAIVNSLDCLGLDVEADPSLHLNTGEHNLQFCLSDDQSEKIPELLELLNQIIFSPTFSEDAIELARRHLLDTTKRSADEELALQSLTAPEVRAFYARWYQPERMHLTIVGFKDSQEILNKLHQLFGTSTEQPKEMTHHPKDMISSMMHFIEIAADHQTRVIDGKIYMKEPNWINKSSNGKTLGALLTLLGIAGIAVAFPAASSLIFVAGIFSTGTGIYFFTSGYLKDPHYVESVRKEDLQNGCAYAYQHQRAGITLTPYERRLLFLQEMIDHPETLPKLPILLLADVYQLNDPAIAEIFTIDEFNLLVQIKRDFIQQRNQYKLLKETLENELMALATPYALARDAALLHAKTVYNQNYYVTNKHSLKAERDRLINDVEQMFRHHEISLSQKEALVEQTRAHYESLLAAPDLQAGLMAADSQLIQMELDIQASYAYQVEICKQSIQYNERKGYLTQGVQSLVDFFDNQLREIVKTFQAHFPALPDYLDLRSL